MPFQLGQSANHPLWVTIGLDADAGHHGVRYISPYRFLPALRLSIDAYPRRRNARSIPSSTASWILRRSSNAILRSASFCSLHIAARQHG